MTDATTSSRKRRLAREPQAGPQRVPQQKAPGKPKVPGKLDRVEAMLLSESGASIAEMVAATGWQQHSVRGAMAGALKKKHGLAITSDKVDGVRRYRATSPA